MTDTLTLHDLEVAIQQKHGADHYLTYSREETTARVFPSGTRTWKVEHQRHTCTHTPPCLWFGLAYWYKGRFTVLDGIKDMPFLTLRETIDRVSGAMEN